MATLTTTLGASFTPVKGRFAVYAFGHPVNIQSRPDDSAAWAYVGEVPANQRLDVENEIAGTRFRVMAAGALVPTINVDQ
jgi:hypothetical protein